MYNTYQVNICVKNSVLEYISNVLLGERGRGMVGGGGGGGDAKEEVEEER